ncbi:hypothetical protein [Streptomyces sp. NPDC005955]|uniref:hypothetical protein n=1 Tax=Streptomyces sp. NPDC005955 TaxID=3364738 RepID=UPI00369EC46A
MITADDYVGRDFAWFGIGQHLGSGADAEVFLCRHAPTRRSYVMRLPAAEDALWERDTPLLPPVNALIEHPNARGSAVANDLYDDLEISVDGQRVAFSTVQLYGVREDRYLLPASNTHQRKGALSFERVLDVPAALTRTTLFWERVQHLLAADCHFLGSGHLSETGWLHRWGALLPRNPALADALDLSELPPRVRSLLALRPTDGLPVGPQLDESAVLRIMYGVLAGTFTPDDVKASLSCPFFRMNITVHDLVYVLALYRLYQPVDWIESPSTWLGPHHAETLLALLDGLSRQPLDLRADRSEFERTDPPDRAALEQYPLVLQDAAGSRQEYVALERTRT